MAFFKPIPTSGGSGGSAPSSSSEISNLSIVTSVAASALTIAVKQADGTSDPSASGPVLVGMRSATLTSGAYNQRTITSALSMVVSSGSTLGQTSAQPWAIYVYLIDNAGTLELAVSGTLFHENQVVSTTAEGGAGAADSVSVMYSTTARSNVPCRLVGKITNTQTTAGTWASAGTVLQVGDMAALIRFTNPTITRYTSGSGTYYPPAGVKYIEVEMIGGGAGGTGSTGNGGAGGNTTFGDWTASGAAAPASGTAGAGGTVTNGTGTVIISMVGNRGGANMNTPSTGGGSGGAGLGGGAGAGGTDNTTGTAATANSGAGGGGTGAPPAAASGAGGGSGGYIRFIPTLATSFSYGVGTSGAAGSGSPGGGAGGSGIIIIREYYN